MIPNTGKRPDGLEDSATVTVKLHSGRVFTGWKVHTPRGSINWRLVPESDPWWPHSIAAWERT